MRDCKCPEGHTPEFPFSDLVVQLSLSFDNQSQLVLTPADFHAYRDVTFFFHLPDDVVVRLQAGGESSLTNYTLMDTTAELVFVASYDQQETEITVPTKQAIACVPCAESFYKEIVGDETCSPCPSNRWSQPGAVGVDQCACDLGYAGATCDACEVGTFREDRNTITCTACPANTTTLFPAANASGLCVCDRGFEANATGPGCVPCAVGFFKASAAQATCEACPENTSTADTGTTLATACKCVPGFGVVENGTGCEICAANTFKAELASVACTPCPDFAEAGEGAVARENCTCRETFVATADGGCTCPAGTFFDNTTETCRDCAADSYKTLPGLEACDACPEFSISEEGSVNRTQCTCRDSFEGPPGGECTCPAGTFFDNATQTCKDCAANTYNPLPGFHAMPNLP